MSETTRADNRSTDGCRTCRTRRVKCDGQKPICSVCKTARVPCKWHREGERSVSPLSLDRARIKLACSTCRSRKVKCPGPTVAGPCERCIASKLDTQCQWSKTTDRSESPSVLQAPKITQMTAHARAEFERLARLYFTTVHHFGFLTFLHQPTFFRLLAKDRIPDELRLTICAVTMRFVKATTTAELDVADAWMDEALSLLTPKLYQAPGAVHLMCVVLAQAYEQSRGRYTSWWMLTSNASRLALYLSLHVFDETFPPGSSLRVSPLFTRESLRRLGWSVFFMDTIADGGRSDMSTLSVSTIKNQLPCIEDAFIVGGLDGPTGKLAPSVFDDPAAMGISAHLLRTAAIRRRILHFAWSVRDHTPPDLGLLHAELANITDDLNSTISSLPARLAYSTAQTFRHGSRFPAFILLHTLRHNCYIILERAKILVYALDPACESLILQCRRDRIARALPTSAIIAEALKHDRVCDGHVAVQAYVALEILILEPRRLYQQGQDVDPDDPRYIQAIPPLLESLRIHAFRSVPILRLHKEASYRLGRVGLFGLLQPQDWAAEQTAGGDVNIEYDFRNFRRDINIELSQRTGIPSSAMSADMLLNQGADTATPSLANSPILDASAPALTNDMAHGPIFESPPQPTNMPVSFDGVDPGFIRTLFGIGDDGGFSGPSEAVYPGDNDPLAWLWETDHNQERQ